MRKRVKHVGRRTGTRSAAASAVRVLTNSAAIVTTLRRLFSKATRGRRRVIIVAYVGADAPRLLPDYHSVELYCWPQPGATDPTALETLASPAHGARVRLCPGLHMKLYWVEGEGCVITSANLSRNALGERSLHEAGVFLVDTSSVDIDAIIGSLDAEPLSSTALQKLHAETDAYWSAAPTIPSTKRYTPTYAEWLASASKPWKLGWWDDHEDEPASVRERVSHEFGIHEVDDYIPGDDSDYRQGDWVLTFRVVSENSVSTVDWLFVERLYRLRPAEAAHSGYSMCAAQVRPRPRYLTPPFKLTADFRTAFRRACVEYGMEKLKCASTTPSRGFLRKLSAIVG